MTGVKMTKEKLAEIIDEAQAACGCGCCSSPGDRAEALRDAVDAIWKEMSGPAPD